MPVSLQPLGGFRDFFPAECSLRQSLFQSWRNVAKRYGFVEYDGPPLEPLELFTQKSGAEIVGQLYNFTDKGNREVTLRAEMTPTLARMVSARQRDFKKPLKWFSIPQVFRYERPQKGRLREHYQFNCDILGEAGLGADIELIACLIDTLRQLGLTSEDFVIRLSDRQFWIDLFKSKNIPEDQWYCLLQAIDKNEREEPAVTRQKLGAIADEVQSIFENGAPSERISTVVQGLQSLGLGDFVQVDFKIVRGLAYYTGIVFEAFDRKGEFRAIAGGGRYDTLLKNLCGVEIPALGFGMGDVVLTELLRSRGKLPASDPTLNAYVVIADESVRPQALAIVHQLREQGLAIDYALMPAKVGKQFEAAELRGAAYAIIVDATISSGNVGLKHLKSRNQEAILVDQLCSRLQNAN